VLALQSVRSQLRAVQAAQVGNNTHTARQYSAVLTSVLPLSEAILFELPKVAQSHSFLHTHKQSINYCWAAQQPALIVGSLGAHLLVEL